MRKRKPTRHIRKIARILAEEGSYTDGYYRFVVKPARKGLVLGVSPGTVPKHPFRIQTQIRMRFKDLLAEELAKLRNEES